MNSISVFRVCSDKRLHGFDDPIGEVPLALVPLRKHQDLAFAAVGLKVEDIREENLANLQMPHFRFGEDLYFSSAAIASFYREIQKRRFQESLRVVIGDNAFNERFALPHQNTTSLGYDNFDLSFHVPPKKEGVWTLPQKLYNFDITIPEQMHRGGKLSYPLCDSLLSRMASPFHALQVSLALNFMRSLRVRRQVTDSWAHRYLSHGSRWFYRGLRRLNKVGKNCQIHPTAVLEGADLGDNVKVGAYSVVRLSKVGSGSVIEDQCCIKYSVLGERTYIAQANQIHLCDVGAESFIIHGPYQFSIFGRSTATMAVINCDYRLDQKPIQIPTDVGLLDSRQGLLGVAYGHAAKVGGGNIIAPGRVVPNGYQLPPPNFIKLDF